MKKVLLIIGIFLLLANLTIGNELKMESRISTTSIQSVQNEPSCDAQSAGTSVRVIGGLGVADKVQICVKTVLDNYVWASII